MGSLIRMVLAALMVAMFAAGIVIMAWPLSSGMIWFWNLDRFHSMLLALIALVAAAVLLLYMISDHENRNGTQMWYESRVAALEALPAKEEDNDDEPDEDPWFEQCPCGSNRPFARCCGKRAFRRDRFRKY